jgi:hypothetical protein
MLGRVVVMTLPERRLSAATPVAADAHHGVKRDPIGPMDAKNAPISRPFNNRDMGIETAAWRVPRGGTGR